MRRARASPSSPTRSRSWRRRRRRRPRTSPAGCSRSRATPPRRWPRSRRSRSIVAQISDRQTTIASAVEEQTATTNEMSRSVQEAASGTTRDRRQHHRRLHRGGVHHAGARPDPHRGGRAVPDGRRPAHHRRHVHLLSRRRPTRTGWRPDARWPPRPAFGPRRRTVARCAQSDRHVDNARERSPINFPDDPRHALRHRMSGSGGRVLFSAVAPASLRRARCTRGQRARCHAICLRRSGVPP